MLGHQGCELGSGGDVQLGENVGEVGLHSPAGDVEPLADPGIGQPLGDQIGDGVLGGGEAVPARLRPAAGSAAAAADPCRAQHRLGAGEVAGSAEPFVDPGGLLKQGAGLADAVTPGERGTRVLAGLGRPSGREPWA